MILSRSFVDVLFILLCGMIVLLSESIRIGSLEVDPAEIGGGGIDRLTADEVNLLVVDDKQLVVDDQAFADVSAYLEAQREMPGALIVPRHSDVSHHRMMRVYDILTQEGVDVRFGVEPVESPQARTGDQ